MSRILGAIVVALGGLSLANADAREPHKAATVPTEALRELAYRVGKWESDGFINGEKQPEPGFETTQRVAGGYCIRIENSWVENGVRIRGSAVVGWDPESKQLVERWYASDGSCASFHYDIHAKKDAWVGSFRLVDAEGKVLEGKSVVEKKSQDESEWNASCVVDGEKQTWRVINRRVK